jgi:hypothetical protein
VEGYIREPQVSYLQLSHRSIDSRYGLLSRTRPSFGVTGGQMQALGQFCTDNGVAAGVEDEGKRPFLVHANIDKNASIHQSEGPRD